MPEFSEDWAKRIREDYLEDHKDLGEKLQRLSNVLRIIMDDQQALGMLASLLDKCVDYTNLVVGYIVAKRLSGKIDTSAYQMKVGEIDTQRRLKHEALMADLKAFRLYLMKHYGPNGDMEPHDSDELPPTVLYTGKTTDRTAIGLWAMRITDALARLEPKDLKVLTEAIGGPKVMAAE